MKKGYFKAICGTLAKSKVIARSRACSFKCVLFALAWLAVLPSCVTQRRVMNYLAEHPLPADTVLVEVIEWRDTTFYVPVPADTVRDSIPVVLPCPDAPVSFTSPPVQAVGKYATATAWIERGQLQIKLTMNDVKIAFEVDSLAALKTKTVTVTNTVTVHEKYVPPFYRATLFVSIILLALFVVIIFIALRR